jgi:MoaA/NifB/PqqE/SkfB family radical SAM enzyme
MSKTFCSYPWEHIYVHTSGHQRLCCTSDENITKDDGYYLYNLQQDGLTDSWNSEYMKNIRKSMIEGKKLKTCYKCWDAIDQGLQALRRNNNQDYHIKNTNPDGSINYPSKDVQLHFGNVCNLNCKMCSQMYSHSIGKELLKMGDEDPDFLKWVKKESGVLNNWTGELDVVYDWYKNEKVKKSIFEHVSQHVTDFNVIGGEPTIIKEFFELLEYCYDQNTLKDKTIGLCTNVTNVNPRLTKWLPEMKFVTIFPSVDGVNDRQAYIRYPSDWKTVVKNLNFYKDIFTKSGNGSIVFQPAIQALNIDMLDEMIDFFLSFRDHNYKCYISFISYVQYPLICNYHFLPSDYKNKVAGKLLKSSKNYSDSYIRKELEGHATNLSSNAMDDSKRKNLSKAFMRYNDQQDKFRRCNSWRQLLPHLETALTESIR